MDGRAAAGQSTVISAALGGRNGGEVKVMGVLHIALCRPWEWGMLRNNARTHTLAHALAANTRSHRAWGRAADWGSRMGPFACERDFLSAPAISILLLA